MKCNSQRSGDLGSEDRSRDLSFEDGECNRLTFVIDYGQLKTIIEKGPRKTTPDLAEELQVSQKNASKHLHTNEKEKIRRMCTTRFERKSECAQIWNSLVASSL